MENQKEGGAAMVRTTPGGVRYEFTRKRVKNLNLRVRADGTAALSAPPGVPAAAADAFVDSRAAWLARARAAALARAAADARPPLVDKAQAQALFTDVCRRLLPAFAAYTGGRMPDIRVRDMKTRWGVCAPAQCRITFAQRLAQQPPAAVVYVAVHELAHFAVPNHSPAFWAVVARVLPDYKARRALLQTPR